MLVGQPMLLCHLWEVEDDAFPRLLSGEVFGQFSRIYPAAHVNSSVAEAFDRAGCRRVALEEFHLRLICSRGDVSGCTERVS